MQNKVRILKRGTALLFAAFMILALPDGGETLGPRAAVAQTIQAVVVEGNRRVDDETVRAYVTLSPGQAYSAFEANESLNALFATGLFSDVRLQMRGNQLVVTVEENPIINAVAFEGNRELKNDSLRQVVESEPRGVLTRARVQNDVVRILQSYRRAGRFNARVEPQIIDLPENRVNLVFEIHEGDKTSVQRINFIGNQAFSNRNLRDVITTSERNWLSWLKSSDIYDPERLEADKELLRRHYLKNGYADFRVVSAVADFDRERNGFFITFTVDEGERYRVGTVDVESYVHDVDPETLRRLVRTRSGDIYNAEDVDASLEEMTFELANRGYAFAQVRPRGQRDFETNTISLTYVVEEGPRVYVERINIRGNTRTLDSVIRREFDFVEGDAYNAVMVDRAKRRLEDLRYFESVDITREPGSAPDRVVLNVAVKEEPTGEISLGGGYSTADGWLADVSVTERNLLGRGHILRVGGTLGQRTRGADFSFTEPYFLGRRLSAGVDAFYRETDYTGTRFGSYRSETIGGGVRFGFNLTENLEMLTRYQLYQTEVEADFAPNVIPPSLPIQATLGKRLYSVAGYDLVYSTIDSYTRPSDGLYLRFSQNVAGLGGDVKFIRSEAEGRYYNEIVPDLIGMLQVRGGHITGWGGQEVLVTDSFQHGGEVIRGFAASGYGPRSLAPGFQQDALGGKIYAAATAELQFPFPLLPEELGFSAAVFADAGVLFDVGRTGTPAIGFLPECVSTTGRAGVAPDGSGNCYVDDTDLRASVGVSVLWNSPFGPLRADVGYAVLKNDYDRTQVLRFGTSRQF
jgi:outer membrane protein insertion porin family